ncbi:TPS7, partial [Symbiodinium sp. KB8]
MKLRAFHFLLTQYEALRGRVTLRQVIVKPNEFLFKPNDGTEPEPSKTPFQSALKSLGRDVTEPEGDPVTQGGGAGGDLGWPSARRSSTHESDNDSIYSSNTSTSCSPNAAEAALVIAEVLNLASATNQAFGEGTVHVRVVSPEEFGISDRLALWKNTDVLCNTTIRDSSNYTPLEYIMARGKPAGVLVLSEFLSLSRALTGSFRVNPMNQGDLVDALYQALTLDDAMKTARRAEMVQWVRTHTTAEWAKHALTDLKEHLASQKDEKEK